MTIKQLFPAVLVSGILVAGILYGSDQVPGYPMAVRAAGPANFIGAARTAIAATVHITVRNRRPGNPFNPYAQPGNGSGSGALISPDGYLVTNNHVVEGASDIRVILSNRRSFPAKLVGSDADNDLAVLKIDADELPYLLYGGSEDPRPGQWVLAAGYPLDLGTTVTAGIVSARLAPDGQNTTTKPMYPRSLIQTDVAINHGNSGGPLVNAEGRLIGINSYFASPTGAYAGYSFAIPVKTVKKVVNRLVARR
ncbi:MAG: trypsin-like peptidase domain-containing protein [Bacteroidota bacterium]|nr:trypsin-like peptidase domain-containing protein [Bacteroidota bacterium]MDP4216922.1 trypsin-like peptidase domain-containing protein [Bacteroidota bacterium]MDP4244885.1 trypsin-like peptidase domain-containing protein [Bacteroidota bacterium]MDP4255471.1 trypsin-like peptidase domain-containing protein [Bacteroidota bacterium]MDP4257112.1 trypsin-like peptidase domain-containing protein [Bacteroidota bacterium]